MRLIALASSQFSTPASAINTKKPSTMIMQRASSALRPLSNTVIFPSTNFSTSTTRSRRTEPTPRNAAVPAAAPAWCLSLPRTQTRSLHHRSRAPPVPRPTPFVPDVPTFLTLIGQNLSQFAPKIGSWNALFTLTSQELKALGVEPARTRKYLLRWRERFRVGSVGVGGDAKHVVRETKEGEEAGKEGVGGTVILGVVQGVGENGMGRAVVNIDGEGSLDALHGNPGDLVRLKGVSVKGARTITGENVLPMKGGLAKIEIREGLWEDKRGRKIDGGERRMAEVRAKKRGEERKK